MRKGKLDKKLSAKDVAHLNPGYTNTCWDLFTQKWKAFVIEYWGFSRSARTGRFKKKEDWVFDFRHENPHVAAYVREVWLDAHGQSLRSKPRRNCVDARLALEGLENDPLAAEYVEALKRGEDPIRSLLYASGDD